ncbi:MAG: hypothetical protein HKN23_17520, partial [Verrucomicrobiales bacterium]|nr:hypothetical protein [Verrucomicrobiales bacterium]
MKRRVILQTVLLGSASLFLLAQDTPQFGTDYKPTHFGIQDGEVPNDPRDFRYGRFSGFPTWKVNQEVPNDVFTFARLRYNSGQWMGRHPKWRIDYPDAELNFSYRLQQLTSLETNPNGVVVDIDAEQLR